MQQERRKTIRRQADHELLQQLVELRDRRGDMQSKEYRHKRRRAIRHDCKVHIALKIGHSSGHGDTWTIDQHPVKGRILDLSGDGCSLFTHNTLDIGQELSLIIVVPGGAKIRAEGAVRWSKAIAEHGGFGSGVQFLRMDPKERRHMLDYLHRLDETIGL